MDTASNNEPSLLGEVIYTSNDESEEFDEFLRSREVTSAPMDGLSERTKTKILCSGWHVPCHCVVARTRESICQAFHVQPNKLGSSLTQGQQKALRQLAKEGGHAIVAKGERSSFGNFDQRELEQIDLKIKEVIHVATSQWWRLLYDPLVDQVWIDAKVNKSLKKYRGFNDTSA